jgi:TetR/AcrR family transcriptional repressor of mexJK operon
MIDCPDTLTLPALAGQEGSRKRRQMLEAALELFLANGYGAVSMDALARAAGVSKATLYAHFQSKDALFGTLMTECAAVGLLTDILDEAPAEDLRAALCAIAERMIRFLLRPRTLAIYRIAIAESARFPELGRAFYASGPRRFRERLAAWIRAQQAAGLVRAADAETAAGHFSALLRCDLFLRATLTLGVPEDASAVERDVSAAVDAWLRAYGTGPAAAPAPS